MYIGNNEYEGVEAPKDYAEPVTQADAVNSPPHYTQGKHEVIDIIEFITEGYDDSFVGYCVGNTVKYVARAPFKHGSPAEDLRKAAWYLTKAADYIGGKVASNKGESLEDVLSRFTIGNLANMLQEDLIDMARYDGDKNLLEYFRERSEFTR